ncbi:hypothetical protein [Bradyrhizobium centrolobii]|nr:hypothetical protein [Bradyrhizobium centrolobii]
MDANLKARWVKALRSKRYRQASGNLREKQSNKRYSYCCLGVLCHTMGVKWKTGVPVLNDTIMEAQGEAYLSYDALKMVGLDDDTQRQLATMNDEGYTFRDIADHIENTIRADQPLAPGEG